MRSKFDEQLADLNREMIEMGNGIIHSIKMAIEALISHDADKARQIMENDIEIDRQQKRIEGICFNLLIQQQVQQEERLMNFKICKKKLMPFKKKLMHYN